MWSTKSRVTSRETVESSDVWNRTVQCKSWSQFRKTVSVIRCPPSFFQQPVASLSEGIFIGRGSHVPLSRCLPMREMWASTLPDGDVIRTTTVRIISLQQFLTCELMGLFHIIPHPLTDYSKTHLAP